MADNQIPAELTALADSLDALAKQVKDGWSNDSYFVDAWGWNNPALNRFQLARMASDLAASVRQRAPEAIDEETLSRVKEAPARIQKFRQHTAQNFYGGNSGMVSSLYLVLLSSIRLDLEPLLGWQTVRDTNLLPSKLAKRLRSFQAQLDEIAPNKEQLENRIKLINQATEAAESLPTDLEAQMRGQR